jgi:hypothetical protein
MRLEPIDPPDEAGQQRMGVAPEVMALERQAVDPLEQHREPLGRSEQGHERIGPRPRGIQDQRRKLDGRNHEQLVVAPLELPLEPGPRGVGAGRRSGQQEDPLGPASAIDQAGEARLDRPGLAGAGGAQHDQRFVLTSDSLALNGKQGV